MTKQILMNVIKGTARQVDFMEMIREQYAHLKQAKEQAGTKPTKIQAAYIEEADHKLRELEDIVKRWIREAFEDDTAIYTKTDYWHKVEKNYSVRVFVEEKEQDE